MRFQTVCWEGRDVPTKGYRILIFGKNADGKSVCASVKYSPYFYVAMPPGVGVQDLATVFKNGTLDEKRYQRFDGFRGGRTYPFAKVSFKTLASLKKASWALKNGIEVDGVRHKLEGFEASLDPTLRLMHELDAVPIGWIDVPDTPSPERITNCVLELSCAASDVKVVRGLGPARLVTCSWDLEVNSGDGSFPDAKRDTDCIINIGAVFQRLGDPDPFLKTCVCLATAVSEVSNADVLIVKPTEKDVIDAFCELVLEHDADVLFGYNTYGFDNAYLDERARKCGSQLLGLSRIFGPGNCALVTKNMSSAAYGDNVYNILTMPGRVNLDLYVVMKTGYKLDSYKLDNVATVYLGEKKHDVSPKAIFAQFKKGEPKGLAEIASYCIQDCVLPLRIIDKLAIFTNLMEMANATFVPVEWLLTRGQQIKCYSQLVKACSEKGMRVPDVASDKKRKLDDEEYVGATVLDAVSGAYMDVVTTTLDFASLYPSIICAHNLCHSTRVLDEGMLKDGDDVLRVDVDGAKHAFVQSTKGVLPEILEKLGRLRKDAKKEMEKHDVGTLMYNIFNGKQMALKVSANSLYGFCGANFGFQPCKPVAATTTWFGRGMIKKSKEVVEEVYNAKVIYGDSVMPYTPITVMEGGAVRVTTIDAMSGDWTGYPGFKAGEPDRTEKEQLVPTDMRVWTPSGWAKVRRVIRHLTTKRIFRVLTHTGLVDVTEDHSLLSSDGEIVKPSDLAVGHVLLQSQPSWPARLEDEITKEQAYNNGHWAINNADKVVPTSVLNGSEEVINAFYHGLGCTDYIDTKNQITAQSYVVLLQRLGYKTSISDKADIYRITYTKKEHEHPGVIEKIYTLHERYTGTVYDLETELGVFHAGVGNLIVKNTDSIFVQFRRPDGFNDDEWMAECFKLGEQAAARVSQEFKKPIKLEMEKNYFPLMLWKKKRYAGLKWEFGKPPKIDSKGIQLVRRDNCALVREVSATVLDGLLLKRDPARAKTIVQESAVRLLSGSVKMEKLVLSKALRSEYKTDSLPHLAVAKKMEERDPGSGPRSGDRVKFVYVVTKKPKVLGCERAEDPDWVSSHNKIKIDYLYYLDHQLASPMTTLFELLIPRDEGASDAQHERKVLSELFGGKDISDLKRSLSNAGKSQSAMTSFFSKQV